MKWACQFCNKGAKPIDVEVVKPAGKGFRGHAQCRCTMCGVCGPIDRGVFRAMQAWNLMQENYAGLLEVDPR